MKHLIDFIDRWQQKNVLVVGDFMLDQLVYGHAERLSPDAPVPVLSIVREESRPGGASNVCLALNALRCRTTCVGLVGRDPAADTLRDHLAEAGCDTDGLLAVDDRPTTVKRSYIGLAQHRHPQKMFRVDAESRHPVDGIDERTLIAFVESRLKDADIICLEDYNKGVLCTDVCRAIIQMARKARIPVIVDPAAIENYGKYTGATAITPNRFEAEKATGRSSDSDLELHAVAATLQEELDLEIAIVTLDRQGMLLIGRDDDPVHVPTIAQEVYDVTGAGDIVIAALAAARVNGADWPDAARFANVAAGLEVQQFGCVPIPLEQIHLALIEQSHSTSGKLRTPDQLEAELDAYRKAGKKIAFTNGCFDILHTGHIELLRAARKTADLLVLAVNTDTSIAALKGPDRPIVPEADRLNVLSELECVDFLITFGTGDGDDSDTPKPLLRRLRPDILCKGGDYDHHEVVGHEIVEQYGGKVVTIPFVKGRSTTNIVERIKAGS